ncbi:MAG: hypothetical protein V4724_12215 [Pseudomonadota bacterium]
MPKLLPKPFKYNQIKDYAVGLADGSYAIDDAAGQFKSLQIPGVQIMRKHAQLARSGDTLAQKFELLFMVLVEQSRALDWRWLPQQGCTSPRLIDGELKAAECAAFASALNAMAKAPAPFGIGVPGGDGSGATVKEETYRGRVVENKGLGFVSFHPRAGVLGLMSNMYTKIDVALPGNLRGGSFYMWSNHKVVRFNNTLFDPTYGKQYAALADMACLNVADWEVLGKTKPGTMDAFVTGGQQDAEGRHLLICETVSGERYYVRMTPSTLVASECQYQGPFTQAQRDWLALHVADGGGPVRAEQVFAAA